MPNNTTNVLTIKANKEEFEKIKEYAGSNSSGKVIPIDFNKIIPMPDELIKVTSPVNIVSQKEYDKEIENRLKDVSMNPFLDTHSITKKMQKDYIKRFGSDNWYDWAVKNWGTKWNSYHLGKWINQSIGFYTAWSPAFPIIKALSEKFPKATFTLQYADEGCYYCGVAVFKNGECKDDCMKDSKDPKFRELYCKLKGGSEKENFSSEEA